MQFIEYFAMNRIQPETQSEADKGNNLESVSSEGSGVTTKVSLSTTKPQCPKKDVEDYETCTNFWGNTLLLTLSMTLFGQYFKKRESDVECNQIRKKPEQIFTILFIVYGNTSVGELCSIPHSLHSHEREPFRRSSLCAPSTSHMLWSGSCNAHLRVFSLRIRQAIQSRNEP